MAQGKADVAAAALRLAIDGETESRLRRARLLEAQVEVSLAVSDLDTASAATEGLSELASGAVSPVLTATAETARGAPSSPAAKRRRP